MFTENPLVSIVIPVYNRENYISDALECALNQTYSNIEIIISDNFSTDSTWDIITKYSDIDSRIKAFRNTSNLGPVMNWKNCFDRVKGDYIKILWSDDRMSLDFVEKSLQLFDSQTAFVMSGVNIFKSNSDVIIWSSQFHQVDYISTQYYLRDILMFNLHSFPVSPGCALFRTSDVLSSFYTEIPNSEKLDFKKYGAGNDLIIFLITASKYKYIRCLNDFASFFRSHSGSITDSNSLDIYYELAKLFFIKNFYNKFLEKYKVKILFLSLRNPNYLSILNHIPGSISFTIILKHILSLIRNRITKIFNRIL